MTTSSRQLAAIIASALVGAGAAALILRTSRANSLHIMFTVFAVVMWLRAANLYARGIGQINGSQLLSQLLFALGMSIATLNYCLASSLQSTSVWVLAGLTVLLVLTGGAFKVRAISTKWAACRNEMLTPGLDTQSDRVVIYPSRPKMVRALLSSTAFVIIGIWVWATGAALGLPWWLVIIPAYVGVPFFAFCGLCAAYLLVAHRPALEIDSTGIIDAASAVGAGRLTWNDLDHITVYKYWGQLFLGIVPKDVGSFLSRQPPVRRFMSKLSMALGCAPINIPQAGVTMALVDLASLLHTRYGVRVEADG